MRLRPDIEYAKTIDAQLKKRDPREALQRDEYGWAVTIRLAIGLTGSALAKRMNISQPALSKLEQNEAAGTITLERLEALAEALDCELVYGFMPKRPLAETARLNQAKQDTARKAKRRMPKIE